MPANFDQTEGQPAVYDVIFLGETDDVTNPETLYDGYHYHLSDWSNLCLNLAVLSGANHYKFDEETKTYISILDSSVTSINQSIYGGSPPSSTSYQLKNDINGNIDDPNAYAANPLIGLWIPLVEKIIDFRARLLLLIKELNAIEPIVNNFAKLTVSQSDLTALRNALSYPQLILNASALQLIREEQPADSGAGTVLLSAVGDGLTDTFTLNSSVSDVLYVTIDGTAETGYSAGGNTITFVAPPANGASIFVMERIGQNYAYGTVYSVRNTTFVTHPRTNTFLVGGQSSGAGGSFDHRLTFTPFSNSLLGVGVSPHDTTYGLSVNSVIDNNSEDASITSYSNNINSIVDSYVQQYISDHNVLKATMQSMIPVIRKGATAISYHVSDSLHEIVYPKLTGNPFMDDLHTLLKSYEGVYANQIYPDETVEGLSLKDSDVRKFIIPTQYSEKVIGATGVTLLQQAKNNLETMNENLLNASKNITINPTDSYYTSSSPIVQNLNALRAYINA